MLPCITVIPNVSLFSRLVALIPIAAGRTHHVDFIPQHRQDRGSDFLQQRIGSPRGS